MVDVTHMEAMESLAMDSLVSEAPLSPAPPPWVVSLTLRDGFRRGLSLSRSGMPGDARSILHYDSRLPQFRTKP